MIYAFIAKINIFGFFDVQNKSHYQYKKDATTARDFASLGDKDSLHRLCANQVVINNLLYFVNKRNICKLIFILRLTVIFFIGGDIHGKLEH